ncbi:hypothetical protein P5673_010114 [Acropora cervicornis]|uniref:Uncharacterized protein n=1 Tax=Acropora cervicornis TaxID=6130 RepID=A0AAD9V935_ACRCE|nr:hypothetical protein P5673_010114 [Acropora cervicornis]
MLKDRRGNFSGRFKATINRLIMIDLYVKCCPYQAFEDPKLAVVNPDLKVDGFLSHLMDDEW